MTNRWAIQRNRDTQCQPQTELPCMVFPALCVDDGKGSVYETWLP